MRKIMPYKSKNVLGNFLETRMRNHYMETKIRRPMKFYEEELCNYLNVSRSNVVLIKNHTIQPSLPLALKIAQFFNVHVEEIFYLAENEEYSRLDFVTEELNGLESDYIHDKDTVIEV